MQNFEDLKFWQKAHQLTLDIYNSSKQFPSEEKFGITNQIRRACSSVPANIAEGYSRKTLPDKLRFYNIALSSLEETRYFLILARDLGLITNYNMFNDKTIEIRKMLNSYISSIK